MFGKCSERIEQFLSSVQNKDQVGVWSVVRRQALKRKAHDTPVEILNREHIRAAQENVKQRYIEMGFGGNITVSELMAGEHDTFASEVMGREAALIDEDGAVS